MNQKEKKYMDYIESRFPGTEPETVSFDFTNGAHSDLAVVGKKTVFKFSKYDWTAVYLTNAWKALRLAKVNTQLPLPDIEVLEPGVMKYVFLKGKPLCRDQLLLEKNLTQEYLAKQLGTFLSQLHAIPPEEAVKYGFEQTFPEETEEYWNARYGEIRTKLFSYCDDYVKASIDRLFEAALSKEDFFKYVPSFIHTDLDARHILYDGETGQICGITGFGRARIGDPARDTGALISTLGESFVKRVSEYYNGIPEQLDRARFYAHLQHIEWAVELADRIATRDFSNFTFNFTESDIMPIRKR